MKSGSENPPQEVKLSEPFEIPFGLNKDIASVISRHLADQDLKNLCLSSKGFYSIFYPCLKERRLMPLLFLRQIAEGHLDQAEEILSNNQYLLYKKGPKK